MVKVHGTEAAKIERKYKIALDILRKCESENLSIADYRDVMAILDNLVMQQSHVQSSGLTELDSSYIYLSELCD